MNDVLSEEQKPSSELLNEYLRAVVKVSAKEAVKVFDNLDKNQLTESSLAMVLRACAATGNASGAKEALRFLYNNGYPLRPAYLAHTIEVFAASNDIETSLRLLREMKEANMRIPPEVSDTVFLACQSPQHWEAALEFFQPSVQAYCVAFFVHGEEEWPRLESEVEKLGGALNTMHFNAMMKSKAARSDYQGLMNAYKRLKENGQEPTLKTYEIILDYCYKQLARADTAQISRLQSIASAARNEAAGLNPPNRDLIRLNRTLKRIMEHQAELEKTWVS